MGRASDVVLLEAGPWTFLLRIDKNGRFPKVEHVVPSVSSIASRLRLVEEDAEFLIATLPRLPGAEDEHPITLDLGSPPVVRSRRDGQAQITEAILVRSTTSGKQVRVNLDRRLLHRALKLGFTEIQVASAGDALTCRDASRIYVFMPYSPDNAIPPTDNALRISSSEEEVPHQPISPERTQPIMPPQNNGNGNENNGKPEVQNGGIGELITEAETIRDLLHEAAGRTARLVSALKQQKRQTRAVQQAVQSLRQLQIDR
jgi:hypothetical protein